MSNQFNMVCPQCGCADALDVAALVWVRLVDDGSDPDESHDGNHEWGDDSLCHCDACGWTGTVLNATPDDNNDEEREQNDE